MPVGWFCWSSLVGGSLSYSCQYLSNGSYEVKEAELLDEAIGGSDYWLLGEVNSFSNDARCAAWLPLLHRSKCIVTTETACLMIQVLHVFLVVATGILNPLGMKSSIHVEMCGKRASAIVFV